MKFSEIPLPDSRAYLLSEAKSLKLPLDVPFEAMAQEAISLRELFIPYRDNDEYEHHGWWSLPIHGLGLDKPMSWDAYGYKDANEAAKDFRWTEICDRCPITVHWLKNVFPSNRLGRVRFMLLEAGGYIAPHRDSPIMCPEPVNIALTHPVECTWTWGDGSTLDFQPGDAYAVNIGHIHSIYNHSNQDRYHIIVHHHDSTPEWMTMMEESLRKQNESGTFYYSQSLY